MMAVLFFALVALIGIVLWLAWNDDLLGGESPLDEPDKQCRLVKPDNDWEVGEGHERH